MLTQIGSECCLVDEHSAFSNLAIYKKKFFSFARRVDPVLGLIQFLSLALYEAFVHTVILCLLLKVFGTKLRNGNIV